MFDGLFRAALAVAHTVFKILSRARDSFHTGANPISPSAAKHRPADQPAAALLEIAAAGLRAGGGCARAAGTDRDGCRRRRGERHGVIGRSAAALTGNDPGAPF